MMRLMAVMAHPDDAEIWCGGTLFLHAEKGDPVRICTISYSGGSTRGREGKQGADKMDCEVEFLGSKDTAIRDTDEIVGKGEMGSDFVIFFSNELHDKVPREVNSWLPPHNGRLPKKGQPVNT
jgi:LmbE family N-acetylglucosaminyl deacetylase